MNTYRSTHPATFTFYRWDPVAKAKSEPAIDQWRMDDLDDMPVNHIEPMRGGYQNKIQVITSQYMSGAHMSLVPKNIDLANWLKDMPDTIHISELTLPATHDSGTFHFGGAFSEWVVCQTQNFTETMNLGVRAFDIRLGEDTENELRIVHGDANTGLRFVRNFLSDVKNYLSDHPSEAFLVELQRDQDNPNTVKAVLNRIFNQSPWKDLIFVPTSKTEFPELKDVRGKIVLIYDSEIYDTNSKGYWLGYTSDTAKELVSNKDSPDLKWFVHSNYDASSYDMKTDNLNNYYSDLIKLNYADSSLMPVSSLNAQHHKGKLIFPRDFANHLNPWGAGKFGELEPSKRLGIVHMDFYADPDYHYNGVGYLLVARNYFGQHLDP